MTRFRRVGLLLITFVGAFANGCGSAVYDERLARTSKLFEYHNTLDQSLQARWSRGDFGISMRVPRGYALLPPPPLPKTLEDGTLEIIEDTRQPAFLGIELPGLVDAWRLPDVGSLYVCSNHERLMRVQSGEAAAADPTKLIEDLEAALQEGLKFMLDPKEATSAADPNARFRMTIPPTNEFAVPKDFLAIAISAGEIENIDPLAGQLYEYQNGPIQVGIVLIYLKSARSNPDRALRLALETLEVSAQAPRGGGTTGAAGAAGGKGPTF